jgi:hypothetical protein
MVTDMWLLKAVSFLSQEWGSKQGCGFGVLRTLRLFRLVRVSRLGRLVRAVPDLVVLVRGMAIALRAVFSTMLLLLIIIYVFAIFFTQTLSGKDGAEGCFDSVVRSMICLITNGVFNSQGPFMMKLLHVHWIYFLCFLLFVVIAVLTVLNMLLGVVCEIVTNVARADSSARIMVEVQSKVRNALVHIGKDHEDMFSHDELHGLLSNPEIVLVLHAVGVDVFALIECSDIIFAKGLLTFDEFVEEVLKFRSSNTCTVKDAVDIRRFLTIQLDKMEHRLTHHQEPLTPEIKV